MPLKKYRGSCHCKKNKFEVKMDLSKGTHRCNCSFCSKVRQWGTMVKPEAFRWLTEKTFLGDYQATKGSVNHHFFCKHCGVRLGSQGYVEEIGGAYISVNISILDNVDAKQLSKLRIQYMDGLKNAWFKKPKHFKHL